MSSWVSKNDKTKGKEKENMGQMRSAYEENRCLILKMFDEKVGKSAKMWGSTNMDTGQTSFSFQTFC